MDTATYLQRSHPEMLTDVADFVRMESPSTDRSSLIAFGSFLADYATAAGAVVELVPTPDGVSHVRAEWSGASDSSPILVLGHFDTVWDVGSWGADAYRVEGETAYGPGIFDMKCGLVLGFWALKALHQSGVTHRRIVFLCTADEEIGSPSSRALIEHEAREAAMALVLEPSERGSLKTSRKGVGLFHAEILGRSSHAGLDPYSGRSAIEELARLVLDLHALADREQGTTINVGVVGGGTRANVVAAQAEAEIDVRVTSRREGERVTGAILDAQPHGSDITLRMSGGMNRPPMERTEGTIALFRQARQLAAELGFDVEEVGVGGASDGNFCSAMGVPVLDGLGAVGGGAHAIDEHIDVSALPARAALIARLLETL